ncbi:MULTISPECIES: hypothetical protein [Cryobacterium]|uniref:AbiEi antitoxin C-terminal domain-containing protein n=1 Tax=Cryobacterium glucosi TaxID=1259175 RepID=A0ABY2IQN4_9MICO|nr:MULTISPECIES: hypothetical protein [Cryobacterium]MDY7527927.1 hypothetical protein [Cryobacterium sp. 10C2]MDY7556311.1 hypothetical protein [Cryobacterium sp. 10C3]MEB0203274.1 hypothetical protein [Cryobacterium sp. 5I3]MEB0285311.1 hypothetical protein [Cryobacterium sp. 10S3]MEB0291883.1 hypothetical protein [Cryobacterium sp. 10C2]
MPIRLPDVLSPRDLPLAELSSLCLDGELFRVGDFWSPVDLAEDRDQRARSLALLVPAKAIAERLTAAWIYGLAPEPGRHQFCVPITARAYFPPSPRFGVREVACDLENTIRVGARTVRRDGILPGGLLVTRPLRTALDLARWPPPESPAPSALIGALLRLAGHPDTSAARRTCAIDRLPYTHRALVQLDAAETAMQALGEPTRR